MGNLPESHYKLDKLHMIFALLALVLLGSLGGLFMKDYSRDWKDYQKRFRVMEIEKARVKQDAESITLNEDTAYQDLLKSIEESKKTIEANCSHFETNNEKLTNFQTKYDIENQKYKQTKADLDATRFLLEESKSHHDSDLQINQQTFDTLNEQTNALALSVENLDTQIKNEEAQYKACKAELTELERNARSIMGTQNVIQRKLDRIDPNEMSLANQLANLIRDLPIIDLSNPNNKIQQIVLKDITDDVIFTQIPKVDRCITCHLGITNKDYEDAPQPFKTHPNLDLFMANDSAHPIEEFGCTICHQGRGRGTSFNSTAHTPQTPQQKREWEENYNWERMHHWDKPMFPVKYSQASCFKCHSGEANIAGAEKLNTGLKIIEKAGCYNCHEIDKYTEWPKSGPDLTKIKSKISKEFAYKWIKDPTSFRHNTWMPSYFNQSNNDDDVSKKRSEQEILAMTHFLFAQSEDYSLEKVKKKGKFENGEKLVASIGCLACHEVKPQADEALTSVDSLRRQHGPNLIGLASKTSKEWIFDWIKNPTRYHPETRMPNLRLSDQEAADIVAYLTQERNTEFDNQVVPGMDPIILDDIALNFLTRVNTKEQANDKLVSMTSDQKLFFSGEKLISQYGCYACHNIKGFEDAKKIGTELTEEGDKSVNKLDFGYIHKEHTKIAWFEEKLKDPRIFDKHKEKAPGDKLIMPNFNLSQEEVESVTTAILGFVNTKTVAKKSKARTPENLFQEKGADLIKQLNCQSCHIIEGEGRTIAPSIEEWLVKYEKETEADAAKYKDNMSPPDLHGIGKKLNTEFLFNFLHSPDQTIRPWLSVRMPSYTFNVDHLNMLIQYFQTIDGETRPYRDQVNTDLTKKEYTAAENLFSVENLDCQKCHVVGSKNPSGTKDTWAPDLSFAQQRLKPEWVIEWIKNPTSLMPGTKMPTFFDPDDFENSGPETILDGNENEQIRVLRNYLMSLADKKPDLKEKKKQTPPPPVVPIAVPIVVEPPTEQQP